MNQQLCCQKKISVQDIGLTGLTHADGLAVGRPSGFVGSVMKLLLSGEFTIRDVKLYDYMRDLLESEDIFLEPSACAAFQGPVREMNTQEFQEYVKEHNLTDKLDRVTHIAWATGGSCQWQVFCMKVRGSLSDDQGCGYTE